MTVEETNIAAVKALYAAFNRGDVPAVMGAVTPDFQMEDVATGRTFQGPGGFMEWLRPFVTAIPDSQTEVTNIVASGEWVMSEHTGRGTHTGPLLIPDGEVPPTGRPVTIRFAEVFGLREGKIAVFRAYYDTAGILRQVGAVS